MKYFRLSVSPKYRGKHQKMAVFKEIIINKKSFQWKDFNYKYTSFSQDRKDIEKIVLELLDATKKKIAPYPNFICVLGPFFALDAKALSFVKEQNIPVFVFNTQVYNDNHEYFFVYFEEELKVDLVASNVTIINGQVRRNTKNDLTIQKPKTNKIGIFSLDLYPNIVVCDEETKVKLEKSKLTGFKFNEIEAK